MTSAISTRLVSFVSGASLRQLQWWTEKGISYPTKDGHCRQWDQQSALVACVASRWRRAGFSLQKIRALLPALSQRIQTLPPYLLTDGVRVTPAQNEREAILFMERSRKPMVVVSLEDLQARIAEQAEGEGG